MQQVTASQTVKRAGFESLKQVSEITGQSHQTLGNWYKNKRQLFNIVILGCQTLVDSQHRQHVDQLGQHSES